LIRTTPKNDHVEYADMHTTVSDVMSPNPASVSIDATAQEALRCCVESGASHAYVTTSSGNLLGVVPDYELLKAKLTGTPADTPIKALMSQSIVATPATTSVMSLAPAFRASHCRSLPVVENGRLVGEISRRDVLCTLIALDSTEGDRFLDAGRGDTGRSHTGRSHAGQTATSEADRPATKSLRGPRFMEPRKTATAH